MLRTVLVPLDGSRISEEVLALALKLLMGKDGTMILLHAVTPAEYFSVTAEQYVQEERRRSASYLQALAELLGKVTSVQERIVTGEASREIVAEAKRSHADLIAMSSHGRSGIRDWPFGSVAERVLRTTNLPVLVFRDLAGKSPTIRKILIALDGSEEALGVVGPAADLAAAVGASVVLAHAGSHLPPSMPLAENMLAQHKVAFEARLLRGEPAAAILEAVERERADLLALTTTGQAKRDRIFFGSVAEEMLKKCGRPLLVVHTGRTC